MELYYTIAVLDRDKSNDLSALLHEAVQIVEAWALHEDPVVGAPRAGHEGNLGRPKGTDIDPCKGHHQNDL